VLSADGGTETVKTLTTDYTVSGVGNAGGGSITMLVAPVTGEKLTITRSVDLDQEVDLQNRGSVNPQTLEDSLDKLTQIAQDQQQQLDRSLKVDLFETADLATLTTNVNAVAAIATEVATVAGISSDVTAVAADATDIGTVAGDIADVTTVAGISSDVTAVAADATDIGTVAGDIADVTTVAGISSDVTTVAGISSDVTTVAGISSDVTAVAADGADIGTVATSIADVNTVAGISADVTTVAGISADVTTVAGISADVTIVADNIADINTKVPRTAATGSAVIPVGTEAQRDGSPAAGYLRFNSDDTTFEGYDGTAWGEIGGSVDFSAVAADIIPDADSTRDIGSTSTRWAQGWFDDVTSTNTSDGTLSIPTTYVTNGSAKAWVKAIGSGTVSVDDSLNIASMIDNGAGDYTFNLTSAMATANVAWQVANPFQATGQSCASPGSIATSSVKTVYTLGGVAQDNGYVSAHLVGDLA
jgi:hypothetical protein